MYRNINAKPSDENGGKLEMGEGAATFLGWDKKNNGMDFSTHRDFLRLIFFRD